MRHSLLALAALSLATAAQADPFLWANLDPSADICVYTPHSGPTIEVPAIPRPTSGVPSGITSATICKIDLVASPTGTNNVTLAAKSSAWGLTSSAVPFAFVRPLAPAAPSGLRLAP